MREATSSGSTLYYFAADHLGSTSVTMDAYGTKIGEMRYLPFGETRPGYPTGSVPTDRRFTGQREETGLGSLYDYGARMYSPVLGRFISADTIVPNPSDPQQLNRYAYGLNNPVKYRDPSGHAADAGGVGGWCEGPDCKAPPSEYYKQYIVSSAQKYVIPAIELAAAVNAQSVGLDSDPLLYAIRGIDAPFHKERSWGIGQIRPSEASGLTGDTYTIEELRDPATSIDLLAAKMARDRNDWESQSYCTDVCDFRDMHVVLAIGQNGFGSFNIKKMIQGGLQALLHEDDLSAAQRFIAAWMSIPRPDDIRTITVFNQQAEYGGGMRYQISMFNQQMSLLSEKYGYSLPTGYDPVYMSCMGSYQCAP